MELKLDNNQMATLAFGVSLGVMVGLRLTMVGMLFAGTILLSALILIPLFWWRNQLLAQMEEGLEILIENPHDEPVRGLLG